MENEINNTETENKESKFLVSQKKLAEVGSQYGRQTFKWNPKMQRFIYNSKWNNDRRWKIHIIDLRKTQVQLQLAFDAIKEVVANDGKVMFVGVKPIVKEIIQEEAMRATSFFVRQRWLGGTLTNFKTIQKSVEKLRNIIMLEKTGGIEKYSRKEQASKIADKNRLIKFIGGIKDMRSMPQLMIVCDLDLEKTAISEARKMGIKIIGLVNTTNDPDLVDIPIPVNNDIQRALRLVITLLADAVCIAKDEEPLFAYKKDEDIILSRVNHLGASSSAENAKNSETSEPTDVKAPSTTVENISSEEQGAKTNV